MNKEQLLKKYSPPVEQIDFLTNYIQSFALTFRERYGKADLEGLHSALAPVFFDKIEHLKIKNGIDSDITEQLEKVEEQFLNNNTISEKFKSIFTAHIKVHLGPKDDKFLTSFSILKMKQSFFLVEHSLNISIKILQPFYSEKNEQLRQQKNFIELLNNLITDLG